MGGRMNWSAAGARSRIARQGAEDVSSAPPPGRKTNRQMPARECRIKEPIEVGKFWKSSRNRRQSIVLTLKSYEGHEFLDCRLFDTNAEGQSVPTGKGVTVGIGRIEEFAAAVNKAVDRARDLGLLGSVE
jgi:hypothetical protein